MKKSMTCKNCQFFQPREPDPLEKQSGWKGGECRKCPPGPDGWPKVWEKDWCGEWRIRIIEGKANASKTD